MNPKVKENLENKYQAQKERVQIMIREAKERYELELTKEIMEDRGNGTLWRNIDKLRGRNTKRGREEKIYQDGKQMELEKALDDFFEVWRLIYNMNENKIDEIWGADTLSNLIEEFRKEENKFHRNPKEYIPTGEMIVPMKTTEMKDEDLKAKLRKLKNNKSAGTDNLKTELLKKLGKEEYVEK